MAEAMKKKPTIVYGTRLEEEVSSALLALVEEERRRPAPMIALLIEEALTARGRYQRKRKTMKVGS